LFAAVIEGRSLKLTVQIHVLSKYEPLDLHHHSWQMDYYARYTFLSVHWGTQKQVPRMFYTKKQVAAEAKNLSHFCRLACYSRVLPNCNQP